MEPSTLTKREFEIAGLTALGLSEKEIATKLFISGQTVHTHKKNLSKKIGAKNIADITRHVISTLANINAREMIQKHILDLKRPKELTVMIVFLGLQIFTMFSAGSEMRRPKKTKLRKEAKTELFKRVKPVKRGREYYLTA